MRFVAVICAMLAGPAGAQDWVRVADGAVEAALDDRRVIYNDSGYTQDFYASGKTLYDSGQPSWGNWRGQGDQYCSEWPPQGGWDCYDLFLSADAKMVRFVGASGHITDGTFAP